jgi:hypothetical protein
MPDPENRSAQESQVLEYAPRRPRAPRRAIVWSGRIAVAVSVIVVLLLAARFIVARLYPPVPMQLIAYSIDDEGVFGGELTIHAVRHTGGQLFRVTFEGRNSGHSGFGSNWVVEGRDLDTWPWQFRYHQGTFQGRDGLTGSFSSRTRSVIIDYAGKHIVFSNANSTLTVDGVSYSTANGPVYLRISKSGKVTQFAP